MEKAHPRYLRPGRPISVSAVPFGPGIDIWRSCRFIGALMRSLFCSLVGFGGLSLALLELTTVDFVILDGKCGHGLTSRPVLRMLFWMSCCSSFNTFRGLLVRCLLVHSPFGTVLLDLLVRSLLGVCQYLGMPLACSLLRVVWRMVVEVGPGDEGVSWFSGSGLGRKRIRLNRKTPAQGV